LKRKLLLADVFITSKITLSEIVGKGVEAVTKPGSEQIKVVVKPDE
jgi:hypothetical protein